MENKKTAKVLSFPMPEKAAWEIIRRTVELDEGGVRFTYHAKTRMQERGVSSIQVINVMKSQSSRMNEGPYQAPGGDWKCEIEGCAAGVAIKIALAIQDYPDEEKVIVITVISDSN